MADLYDRYLGPTWRENPANRETWQRVDEIPDAELWRTHERRRERLVAFARRRLVQQMKKRGAINHSTDEHYYAAGASRPDVKVDGGIDDDLITVRPAA